MTRSTVPVAKLPRVLVDEASRFGDAEYARLVTLGWNRDSAAKAAATAERNKRAELNASKP
jgi:hypothetical protein